MLQYMHCKVDGCTKNSRTLGMCVMHYTRMRRNGTLQTLIGHPSKITIQGDVAKIHLQNGIISIIDAKDVDIVKYYKWSWSKSNGVIRNVWQIGTRNNRHVKLHRQLLCPPDNKDVDHINGDRLDNRRANLRVVSHWENMVNRKSGPMRNIERTGSGYCVRLAANRTRYYVGHYTSLKEAIAARNEAAKKLHGEIRKR